MLRTGPGVRRLAVIIAAAGMVLAACGSSASPAPSAQATAAPTAEATAAPSASAEATAAATASSDIVAEAKKVVADQLAAASGWDGPTSGSTAQGAGGTIVYVASDLTNGGISAVGDGIKEAATAIGWDLKILDGKASVQGRTDAMSQAIALKPAGIILGGFNAEEQKVAIEQATAANIPVVGWHAASAPGPDAATGLFTNVTTDPLEVSKLAAYYAIADSDGTAGVIIYTDSQYQIAIDKANAIKAEIEKCSTCTVLAYEDSPIAEAQSRMPSLVASELQKYGDKFTYMLAINGNYFAGSRAALVDAGKSGTDAPHAVAAGDGDAAEFQRIRNKDYQMATVAEPLYLQGWQLVDELNRALAGAPESGYVAPPGLIDATNVPDGTVFDPATAYRDNYKKIWGK
jgi:ribose transport system substrate-binding protein